VPVVKRWLLGRRLGCTPIGTHRRPKFVENRLLVVLAIEDMLVPDGVSGTLALPAAASEPAATSIGIAGSGMPSWSTNTARNTISRPWCSRREEICRGMSTP